MALITDVRYAHEDGALADTLNDLPDLDVRVVKEASTNPGQSVYYFRFDHDSQAAVEAALAADHTVERFNAMPEFRDQPIWGVEFAPETNLLSSRVTNEGGFVVEARGATLDGGVRGWHERWLLPDREAVHDVWTVAREDGYDFEILELRRHGESATGYPGSAVLTDEQRDALAAALDAGYFTEPRDTSLEDLAEDLDLSPSAVGGRIRRGLKTLIGGTLAVDRPAE